MVAGDHHDADAGAAASRDRRRHRRAQRIGERDEAETRSAKLVGSSGSAARRASALARRRARAGPRAAIAPRLLERCARARRVELAQVARPPPARPSPRPRSRRPSAQRQHVRDARGARRDSGYSRTSVQLSRTRSVSASRASASSRNARSIGSNGSQLAGRAADSTSSARLGQLAARRVGAAPRATAMRFSRERAGLVDAEHGRRAERLDRRHAPREHPLPRDPPRAQREEHREHHRKLLRQDRHRQREAGEQPVEPARLASCRRATTTSRQSVNSDHREHAHHARRLLLEGVALDLECLERRADLADLGCGRPWRARARSRGPRRRAIPSRRTGDPSPPGSAISNGSCALARLEPARDSPVSSDSSVAKSVAFEQDAVGRGRGRLRREPASRRERRRGPAMRRRRPSRITRARGLERSRSASSARSVLRSW